MSKLYRLLFFQFIYYFLENLLSYKDGNEKVAKIQLPQNNDSIVLQCITIILVLQIYRFREVM